ncbi:MAG: cell division protein FtsQ/DivIB [Roseiflexaceae bacterium]
MNAGRRRSAIPDPPPTRRRRGVRPGVRLQVQQFIKSGRIISVVLLVFVLWYTMQMMWSDAYVVRNVNVLGAATMSRQRVIDMTELAEASIWSVQPDAVRARLLANPYVTTASVEIQLPDTVTITLSEQQSEIRWKSGQWYLLVNSEGEILGIDAAVVLTGTLVINDDSGQKLVPGDTVDPDILALARDVSLRVPAETGLTVNRVGWDPIRGVSFRSGAGELILVGRPERLDEKLALLRQLRDTKAEFAFVDLRPLTAYYRLDIPVSALVTDTQDVVTDSTVITATTTVP